MISLDLLFGFLESPLVSQRSMTAVYRKMLGCASMVHNRSKVVKYFVGFYLCFASIAFAQITVPDKDHEAARKECLVPYYVRDIVLSPTGDRVITGAADDDRLFRLWRKEAARDLRRLSPFGRASVARFLADGSGIAGDTPRGWRLAFDAQRYDPGSSFFLDVEHGYWGLQGYLSALPDNYRQLIGAAVEKVYDPSEFKNSLIDSVADPNTPKLEISFDQDGMVGWVDLKSGDREKLREGDNASSDSARLSAHIDGKVFPSPGYGPFVLGGGFNDWVLPHIRIQKDAAGSRYVTSDALIYRLRHGALTSTLTGRAAFFSHPLTDSRTGYLLGTFDERSFSGLKGSKWLSRVKIDDPHAIIISAAALAREKIVAWTSWSNGHVFLRAQRLSDGADYREEIGSGCEYARVQRDIRYETLLLGRDWKVPARLFAQAKTPSRGLVVYVHGGPGGSFQDLNRTAGSIKPYLDDGFDVLAVDYSGALGTGPLMSERLREYGGKALEKDAAAIRRFIEKSAYARIGVVGGSMGSLVSTQLATSRRVNALFLEVPWFDFHLPPGFDKPEAAPYRADLLSDFKDALGSDLSDADSEFRRWMRALRENCQTRKDLAVFVAYGKDDYKVRPEDLPSCFADATIEVLAGGHSFTNGIESDAPMRTRFMNMLAPRPANDPPN